MSKLMRNVSPDMLRECLEYNSDTGLFTWRKRSASQFLNTTRCPEECAKAWNNKNFGKQALITPDGRGYLFGGIFGFPLWAHRAAWAVFYGVWPATGIDHMDGDKSNNRIVNLRDATKSENSKNTKIYCTNSSGHSGIGFCKQTGKWKARIGGKHIGRFSNVEDALLARKLAEKNLGYHHNHGRIETKGAYYPSHRYNKSG